MARFTGIVFVLFLSGLASSSGQVVYQATVWYDLDSLESVLPNQEGTEKINTLNRIAATLCFEDFDESLRYAKKALELSHDAGYKEGIASATRFIGHAYYYNGEYPKALDFLWKSRNEYEVLNNNPLVGNLLLDMTVVHAAAKNYDKALEIINEALETFRNLDPRGTTIGTVLDTLVVYSTMAMIMRLSGRADSALNIYTLYLDVGNKTNLELTNMMVHLGNAADACIKSGNADSALFYYREGLRYPEINQSIIILKKEFKRRIGMVHLLGGRVDSATGNLTEAFQSLSQHGFLMQSQQASQYLGEIYLKMNDLSKSRFYFNESEKLLEEELKNLSFYRYDSLKYTVSLGWEVLAPLSKKFIKELIYNNAVSFYGKMIQYSKAGLFTEDYTRFLEAYVSVKDTLTEIERKRELIEIQTKFDTERKEEEIITLSQENELKAYQIKQSRIIQFGLVGVLFFGLAFVILFIRQNKLKEEQEKTHLQQKLFRTQMNPHFIFNSLSSIQHLVMNEESEKASIFLAMFSTLVRNVLNSSVNNAITIEEEVKTIESYLALQKIRYSDKFDFIVGVDPQMETESITIPPMLAQPFIENSIEHGMKYKMDKGQIDIRFKLAGDFIIFEVEDNGIGRKKANEMKSKNAPGHKSMATGITQERINVINRKKKRKISLNIIDLKDESGEATGTKVMIEIPFEVV